ncbi:MAG: DHA2 family efflux MFS transporter permease subunit [Thermoleophilia bacterium]|nr:DHA2 family efflux MFS transporter permease subunit [Thermoleophilia bacterium]
MNEATLKRNRWLTLIAMTLSSGMILVDQTSVPLAIPDAMVDLKAPISDGQWILTANMLPLAAFMVIGGRLGDIFGLRKIFLIGALIFSISSAFAGFAQNFEWMVAARASQGLGAALMMPTAVAIVSATFPKAERGKALGILAGSAAFLAALGPVVGGGLATLDWRLVFLVNVPLAIATVVLTLKATPPLSPKDGVSRQIDYAGVITFSLGIAGIVYGLGQGQNLGWTDPQVIGSLVLAVAGFAGFVVVEHLVKNPMIEFKLFRHKNFLAANISQFLSGSIELGTAYLLPYFLLIIIGVSPLVAGLALIPATVPIILAGPLAGKWFDKVGGRMPLVVGFLTLSLSGLAMAFAAPTEMYVWLIPGLILQGIGLGIVLTVNDPTGLSAVPPEDQGQAAGVINTTEQLGGAVGIAVLSAIMIGTAKSRVYELLGDKGIKPTPEQDAQWKDFMLTIETKGLKHIDLSQQSDVIKVAVNDVVTAHTFGYEIMFFTTAGIGLLGALVCWTLVRKTDRIEQLKVFSRRSSWQYTSVGGRSPGLTKHPAPPDEN